MNHVRAIAILGSLSAAFLAAGCSTTSPGVTYYDVSAPSKATSQKDMSDVFVLDKATLKVSFPAGSKPKNPDSKTSSDTTPQSNSAAASDGNAKATKPAEASKAQVKVELEISEDASRRIGIAGAIDWSGRCRPISTVTVLAVMGVGIILKRRRDTLILRRFTIRKKDDECATTIHDLRRRGPRRRMVLSEEIGVAPAGIADIPGRTGFSANQCRNFTRPDRTGAARGEIHTI